MKTNEAPEKIFLEWYRIGDKKYRDWCIVPKTNDEPVEYTRTDAFIEKACDWIVTNMDDYIHVEYDTVTGMPTNEAHIANKIVIDDFKKYMKG